MRFTARAGSLIVFGLALSVCSAQPQTQKTQSSDPIARGHRENTKRSTAPSALSPDDGLSVIAAALDARTQAAKQRDCSHLVHAVYLRAGFIYPYASSSDLYAGADDFQRVARPQPGDLVVWPGHVGIVVNPAQRLFFSKLGRGPGVDAYDAQYWKERGQVRFYRYVKKGPARVTPTPVVVSQRHK